MLPPTDQICLRLLSGDPGNDGTVDDRNGNGTPDLEELLGQLFGGAPAAGPPAGVPSAGGVLGLPVLGGSAQ